MVGCSISSDGIVAQSHCGVDWSLLVQISAWVVSVSVLEHMSAMDVVRLVLQEHSQGSAQAQEGSPKMFSASSTGSGFLTPNRRLHSESLEDI